MLFTPQVLLTVCIFGTVALVAFVVASVFLSGDDRRALRGRLKGGISAGEERARQGGLSLLQRIGQACAQPFMPKTREKQSGLRRSLGRAGIYNPSAIKMVTGAKLMCLVGGIVAGYVAGTMLNYLMLGLSVGGLVGYMAPAVWLKMKISANQKAIQLGLPDALDLMVVCVEAGLTVDSAMQRIGQELVIAHPAISREFGITHMETRVGLSRAEAMKNMGVRTGSPVVQSLVSMLVQADRFGTSVASSLRIHADSMRVNRQFQAEEQAARASVKMSFPLVLFIFPATFLILAGPTVIGLMKSPLFQ